jgi:hypothetical protein
MSSSPPDTISGANGLKTHAATQGVYSNHFRNFCAARPQAEEEYNRNHPQNHRFAQRGIQPPDNILHKEPNCRTRLQDLLQAVLRVSEAE